MLGRCWYGGFGGNDGKLFNVIIVDWCEVGINLCNGYIGVAHPLADLMEGNALLVEAGRKGDDYAELGIIAIATIHCFLRRTRISSSYRVSWGMPMALT